MSVQIDDVRRFTTALRTALEDLRDEREGPTPVLHYFDTDVVYGALDSLRDMRRFVSQANRERKRDLLVRAMWMCGGLMRCVMTWPHIIEFRRKIYESEGLSPQEYRDLSQELDASPLDDLAKTARLVDSDDKARHDVLRQLMSEASDTDPMRFSELEATIDRPRNRWNHLLRFTDPDRLPGPKLPALMADDRLDACVSIIAHARGEVTDDGVIVQRDNTVIDALAVLALDSVQSPSNPDDTVRPRFYTHTAELATAIRSKAMERAINRVEQDLTSPDLSPTEDPGVVRDSYYYMLRCIFPALGFGSDVDRASGARAERSLVDLSAAALTRFCDTLADIVDAWEGDESMRFQDVIAQFRGVEEMLELLEADVPALVAQFEANSVTTRVWLDSTSPTLQRLAGRNESAKTLLTVGKRHRPELQEFATQDARKSQHRLNAWNRAVPIYGAIRKRVEAIRDAIDEGERVTLYEDLALARWRAGLRGNGRDYYALQTVLTNAIYERGRTSQHLARVALGMSAEPFDEHDSDVIESLLFGTACSLGLRMVASMERIYDDLFRQKSYAWPPLMELFKIIVSTYSRPEQPDEADLLRIRALVDSPHAEQLQRSDLLLAGAWCAHGFWRDHWRYDAHKHLLPKAAQLSASLASEAGALFEEADQPRRKVYARVLEAMSLAVLDPDHQRKAIETLGVLRDDQYAEGRFPSYAIAAAWHSLASRPDPADGAAHEARWALEQYEQAETPLWRCTADQWLLDDADRISAAL